VPGGSTREQPPRRAFAERKHQQHTASANAHVSDASSEVTLEINVGEDHLFSVLPAAPADARRAAHGALRSVAPADERKLSNFRPGCGLQLRAHAGDSVLKSRQLESPLHLDPASRERPDQHVLDILLPHQREMRKRRLG
jgi:hypothetical protein